MAEPTRRPPTMAPGPHQPCQPPPRQPWPPPPCQPWPPPPCQPWPPPPCQPWPPPPCQPPRPPCQPPCPPAAKAGATSPSESTATSARPMTFFMTVSSCPPIPGPSN